MMRVTPMVKNILIINIGIAIIQWITNLPLNEIGALRVVFSEEFEPYQFITYMWLHSTDSIMHLFGNMFAVFIFGPLLEQFWGPKRFLTFYLICGIGAGVLYGVIDYIEKVEVKNDAEAFFQEPSPEAFYLFITDHKPPYYNPSRIEDLAEFSDEYYDHPQDPSYDEVAKEIVHSFYIGITNVPMVGASGAVFGILMAFGMLFPNTQLFLLFPPIPIKAKYLVLFYGLYELYSEFARMPGDNVAHLAHLGGMLIAFILLKIWQKDNRRFY